MQRQAVDFRLDDENFWMAVLACGHTQHVRHQPPFVERPWTQSESGRASMLGTEFDCLKCVRLEVPDGFDEYSATPWFDEQTVPAGLRADHSTKRGVWGRIEVTDGALDYEVTSPFAYKTQLGAGHEAWIPPEAVHHVTPVGTVRFRVHFLKQTPART